MPYKVILKRSIANGDATWEPGCPIAVSTVQVSRDIDTGQAFLQTRIRNLADVMVETVIAEAEVIFHHDAPQIIDLNLLDADIIAGGSIAPNAITLAHGDVLDVTVRVKETRSAKGTWTSSNAPVPIPTQKEFTAVVELVEERDRLFQNHYNGAREHFMAMEDHGR